jgi:hypothetical protein
MVMLRATVSSSGRFGRVMLDLMQINGFENPTPFIHAVVVSRHCVVVYGWWLEVELTNLGVHKPTLCKTRATEFRYLDFGFIIPRLLFGRRYQAYP